MKRKNPIRRWGLSKGFTPVLPRAEWDFDDLPPNMEAACFWWEFAREAFGDEAEYCREEYRKIEADHAGGAGAIFAWMAKFPSLLRFFALEAPDDFPRTPWQQGIRKHPGLPNWDGTLADVATWPFHLRVEEGAYRSGPEAVAYAADPAAFVRGVKINWRFSDAQIGAAFAEQLRKHRPKEWPEPRRPFRPPHPRIGNAPVRYLAALHALGVMRLRRAGVRPKGFGNDYGHYVDSASDLRRDERNARRVIEWVKKSDVRAPKAVVKRLEAIDRDIKRT